MAELTPEQITEMVETWGAQKLTPLEARIATLETSLPSMGQEPPSTDSDNSSVSHNHHDCEVCVAQSKTVYADGYHAGQEVLAEKIDQALLTAGGDVRAQVTALIQRGLRQVEWQNEVGLILTGEPHTLTV